MALTAPAPTLSTPSTRPAARPSQSGGLTSIPGSRPSGQTAPAAGPTSTPDRVELSPAARAATTSGPGTVARDPNNPADLTDSIGTLEYYRQRHDDFVSRNPGVEPPDYYMDYGDKYARRFTEELYPNLSERGQEWLVDARRGLQERIEARRAEDPAAFAELERNPDAFRRFAYDTHPDAYLDAGLASLPPRDLIQIPLTPDRRDLLSADGIRQAAIAGVGVVGDWGGMAADAIADSRVGQTVAEGARYVANSQVGRAVADGAQWISDSPVGDAARGTARAVSDGAQWVADSRVGRAVGDGLNAAGEFGWQAASVVANGVADGVDYVADSQVGRAIGSGVEFVADSAVGRTVGGWANSAWDGLNSFWD